MSENEELPWATRSPKLERLATIHEKQAAAAKHARGLKDGLEQLLVELPESSQYICANYDTTLREAIKVLEALGIHPGTSMLIDG